MIPDDVRKAVINEGGIAPIVEEVAIILENEIHKLRQVYLEGTHSDGALTIETKLLDDGIRLKWSNSRSSFRVFGYRSIQGIFSDTDTPAPHSTLIINSTSSSGEFIDPIEPGTTIYYTFFLEGEEKHPGPGFMGALGFDETTTIVRTNVTGFSRFMPDRSQRRITALDREIEEADRREKLQKLRERLKTPLEKFEGKFTLKATAADARAEAIRLFETKRREKLAEIARDPTTSEADKKAISDLVSEEYQIDIDNMRI